MEVRTWSGVIICNTCVPDHRIHFDIGQKTGYKLHKCHMKHALPAFWTTFIGLEKYCRLCKFTRLLRTWVLYSMATNWWILIALSRVYKERGYANAVCLYLMVFCPFANRDLVVREYVRITALTSILLIEDKYVSQQTALVHYTAYAC